MAIGNQSTEAPRLTSNYDYADIINPTAGAGFQAPVGSTYRYIPVDGSAPSFYQKTGAAATAWTPLGGAVPPVNPDFVYTVGVNAMFSTIQAAITQALADGCGNGQFGQILVAPGQYIENLTFTDGIVISPFGESNGAIEPVTIGGHHTFTPTAGGNQLDRAVYLVSLTFSDNAIGDTISVLGVNPGFFSISQCNVLKNTAGHFLTINPPNVIGVAAALVAINFASTDSFILANNNIMSLAQCSFQSFASAPLVDYNGTAAQLVIANCIVLANGPYIAAINSGNCVIFDGNLQTLAANADGVRVAAGANVTVTNTAILCPVGTGYVFQGAGTVNGTLIAYINPNKDPGLTFNLMASDPPTGGAGANQALSNLTPGGVLVNTDLTPGGLFSVGTGAAPWNGVNAHSHNVWTFPGNALTAQVIDGSLIASAGLYLRDIAGTNITVETGAQFRIQDNSLAGAVNGYVWTLIDQVTGQGGWAVGGGAPSGDPNTLAYFNALGVLTDNTSAKFDGTLNASAVGIEVGGGLLTASGNGAAARGFVSDPGSTITASADGSLAFGVSNVTSSIRATSQGSVAYGYASSAAVIEALNLGGLAAGASGGAAAIIRSSGYGAHVSAYAQAGALFWAQGNGSHVWGSSNIGAIQILASADGASAGGFIGAAGQIVASGQGARASGYADTATITSSGFGSEAGGGTTDSGTILASGTASRAFGAVDNAASEVSSVGPGSLGFGHSYTGGVIQSVGSGAVAFGDSADATSQIISGSPGSMAFGSVDTGGLLSTSGDGSMAHGYASGAGSKVETSGEGASAFGYANAGAIIVGKRDGCLAFGYATDVGSFIQAGSAPASKGALAFGVTSNVGTIFASGLGTLAFGHADNGDIEADGAGSIAAGYASGTGAIFAGPYSIAVGVSNLLADPHGAATAAASFGEANNNTSYASLAIGKFCDTTGATPGAWVATDPLIAAGNGVSGVPANALRLDKDGKLVTTGAEVHTAIRAAVNPDNLSARTDRSLMVDTSVGAAPYVVNMPAGETGLEFFVKDIGNNAAVNNITFTPNGGDLMEASSDITNNRGTRHFQFFGGTWYIMNLP
jgi:hypothetical protein